MKPFITGHEELIHDIRYDFYGKHIATASSDQHIKVFDLDTSTSTWVLNDLWKAHDSSITKVLWAHPEFSSSKILASCSFDRTVKIWQEQPDELHGSGRRWIKLATLAIESFGPIYDVVFAPNHLGLKLGCVGSDGIFRIYESLEPGDLTNWALTTELPILYLQLPAKSLQSSFAIEWCPAKFSQTEKFIVIALDQGFIYGTVPNNQNSIEEAGDAEEVGNKGDNKYSKLGNLPEHNGLIRSVSWAPSMGRNYHLIATGCKDGYVRIFKGIELPGGELKVETLAKLNDHKLEVWRVSWNLTGTILSSAGDDGKIRLWKCNYLNEWKCMSVINTDNRSVNRVEEPKP
ncbi:WD40 repeat-like protein [Suhomyces tanzawaensis NRRL Y-17324]|uniref:WD40 repeat-like protein n=1 Tax=Suhomyces tanzawaensis NRRL Y-17324 TaxID=984487 RepID=A0A1E4SR67_9ASCO|nr:WD40 repeat-like protein [Suhomyces tanzawaensis NRRL Y-17324]ODV81991.1 WD40 repeat-like protein [Suhomyces tanzawaensis NRRL Y-17324]